MVDLELLPDVVQVVHGKVELRAPALMPNTRV
jgi:hypothetical protein